MELDAQRRQALLNATDSQWRTTSDLIQRSQVPICRAKASKLLRQCEMIGLVECRYQCSQERHGWMQPLWRRHA